MPRPAKRAKLLADVGASDASEDEGVKLPTGDGVGNGFTINEDYAKRFEHNKKREDKQRLEEKFKGSNKRGRIDDEDEEEDSEDDETEDDDADLATVTLDREIMDTLQAIRNKDPRVYDKDIKFYRDIEEGEDGDASTEKETKKDEKPMYLQDYHRRNLLAGHAGGEDEEDEEEPLVQTYQQEQDALKRELVGSMHTAGKVNEDEASSGDEGDFLVAKSKPKHEMISADATAAPKSKPKVKITENEIAAADKDPETYLSNFMASRAWLPNEKSQSRFTAMDSDDSEDDRRAEEFEEAYNMRFEDPRTANEKLLSFARDVGKYGVRRDEVTRRKKAREREREEKERAKAEREEDRARLRRLRIEEVEEKVQRIKEAAGLKGKDVNLEQWRDIIEGDFDDAQWDAEMTRRFGENYYAEAEGAEDDDDDEEEQEEGKKRHKVKKPKWDDDIDIKDLVPDFKGEKDKPDITLSSDEEADDNDDDDDNAEGGAPLPPASSDDDGEDDQESKGKKSTKNSKKARAQAKADAKRTARLQRRQIEALVDSSLPLSHPSLATAAPAATAAGAFRYRETSPTSFGLSARDILFADDSQLNSFVGLKKLHGWRDEEKKRRDKKTFSKKGRLREFRREAFGGVEEPVGGFEKVLGLGSGIAEGARDIDIRGGGEGGSGKRKKKRSGKGKKGKAKVAEA